MYLLSIKLSDKASKFGDLAISNVHNHIKSSLPLRTLHFSLQSLSMSSTIFSQRLRHFEKLVERLPALYVYCREECPFLRVKTASKERQARRAARQGRRALSARLAPPGRPARPPSQSRRQRRLARRARHVHTAQTTSRQ